MRRVPNRSSLVTAVIVIGCFQIQLVIDDLRDPFAIAAEYKAIDTDLLVTACSRANLLNQIRNFLVNAEAS